MNHNKKSVAFFVSLATLLVCTSQVFSYAEEPVKVAILPVKIHAPEKMEYLQAGLMDMLASRIGGKHDVQVLDRKQVAKTFKKFKKDLNQTTARSLAEDLGADYIVSGSVTFFGTGGSIDFKVFSRDLAKPPLAVYGLIQDMNNLLPKFSQAVDEMNAKAFDPRSRRVTAGPRPQAQQPQATQAAPLPAPKPAGAESQAQQIQAAPAPVPPETTPTGPKMASIQQELVREKPISTDISKPAIPETTVAPQPGPWKSQELHQAALSMDVGDLLGEGSIQLVTMSRKKILVHRYQAEGLKELAKYRGAKGERFVWVSVADINRNGRDEIFVTSQKKLSASKIKLSSFVLEWDGKQLSVLLKDIDYYLRVERVPGEPARLLGQKSAKDGSFLPEIHHLVWKNNGLAPASFVSAPKSVDLFNASMGDITGHGKTETIMINSNGYLLLLDITGQAVWKSYDSFGSSGNYIETELSRDEFPQPNEEEGYRFAPTQIEDPNIRRLYVSSPILLTDLNRDAQLEVVVTHNLPSLAQIGGSRDYSKSEILSLSWGGNGMLQNWKTAEIKGMISSLLITDLNGDGKQELIVCINKPPGITGFWRDARSVIMSYGLR
jgi:hypothetical protein